MASEDTAPGQTLSLDQQKKLAGYHAATFVQSGQVIGLGTGSTVRYVLDALGERVREGLKVTGVSTSIATQEYASRLGIGLAELDDQPSLDLTIDGADEIDPALDLIKGLGGALVREMIVAAAGSRLIIIADETKPVPHLGSRAPVPVAVFPFGWRHTQRRLADLGCRVEPRLKDGSMLVTDDGLYILDCFFGPIGDPAALERRLLTTVGVAATGLFIGYPVTAVVGRSDGTVVTMDK